VFSTPESVSWFARHAAMITKLGLNEVLLLNTVRCSQRVIRFNTGNFVSFSVREIKGEMFIIIIIIIIIIIMALQPFVGPWSLFQFLDPYTQSVGLLGRGISPSEGRYLRTGQHKQ
jgi:hypothetical protein